MAVLRLSASEVERTRLPLERASQLPGAAFTDPAVLAWELDQIFTREWVCVGHINQVNERGTYLMVELGDESVLVIADDDGEARAGWLAPRLGDGNAELAVARVAMDFRRALTPSDGDVVVRCALDHLGGSSVRTRESIETADGVVVTVASTTLLALDSASGRPRALSAAESQALSS